MIRDKNQLKLNCCHKSKKSLSPTYWFSWLSKVCSKSIKEWALLNLRTVFFFFSCDSFFSSIYVITKRALWIVNQIEINQRENIFIHTHLLHMNKPKEKYFGKANPESWNKGFYGLGFRMEKQKSTNFEQFIKSTTHKRTHPHRNNSKSS